MLDIEEFLHTKKKNGQENFNNFDHQDLINNYHLYFQIINNLLLWINNNKHLTTLDQNNKLYELFKDEFTKELRKQSVLNKSNNKNKQKKSNLSCRKSTILYFIKNILKLSDINNNLIEYIQLLKLLLRKKPFRNVSGITSITVLTSPFPDGQKFSCQWNCYYCPNEPAHEGNKWQAQPRSYLYLEPAVQRANEQKFGAIGQMFSRMDSYYSMGHIVDKLELIIEGGTHNSYPKEYLERYYRDLFYAANIYWELRKLFPNYDDCTYDFDFNLLKSLRQPLDIRQEIEINKSAEIHIIGICIETRPDTLHQEWLECYRKWGITRIQLGAQHVDNSILKKINRGHTVEQLLWAMQYLYDNCFKVDIHIMPDLPGATPEIDRDMFDYVYSIVCPDQMKVYPHEIVPWTITKKWYDQGKYKPYFEDNPEDLIGVVRYSMEKCPAWCRLPRVVRDIPINYIECGNTHANLRQMIDDQLDKEGIVSMDIRSREIGRHSEYYKKAAFYNTNYYYSNNGHNYHIEYVSLDKRALFGFIRLRIVDKNNLTCLDILKNKGLIRELHVYGDTTAVNKEGNVCQHRGIGKGLLERAEIQTMKAGLYGIVVISGEGVKGYYENRGYKEIETFMVKMFPFWKVWFYMIINILQNYIYFIKK